MNPPSYKGHTVVLQHKIINTPQDVPKGARQPVTGHYTRTTARTEALYSIRPIEWVLIVQALQAARIGDVSVGARVHPDAAIETLLAKIRAI